MTYQILLDINKLEQHTYQLIYIFIVCSGWVILTKIILYLFFYIILFKTCCFLLYAEWTSISMLPTNSLLFYIIQNILFYFQNLLPNYMQTIFFFKLTNQLILFYLLYALQTSILCFPLIYILLYFLQKINNSEQTSKWCFPLLACYAVIFCNQSLYIFYTYLFV